MREDSNSRKREELIASCPTPAKPHAYTEHDTYGMEYFHWPDWLSAWLCSLPAPAHLLISWVWEMGKSLWFHSNRWKHQCYQHSSCTKSKTEQLLRRQLTPSRPKPGQCHNTDRTELHSLYCIPKIQLGSFIYCRDKVEQFWNTHNVTKRSELLTKCNVIFLTTTTVFLSTLY